MARKTKDLFQLLEKRRAKGSFRSNPEPDAQQPRDLLGGVTDWLRTLVGNRRPRRRAKKRAAAVAASSGFLISGPTILGIAFGSLVVGFLLGQGLATGRGQEPLDTAGKVEPSWLPGGEAAPGILPEHLQMQRLSEFVYLLGRYPVGADREASRGRAERLATYLRARGLERTRIFLHWFPDGTALWLTVYYTTDNQVDQPVLQRLQAIEAPPFEPTWAQTLEALLASPAPAALTQDGG